MARTKPFHHCSCLTSQHVRMYARIVPGLLHVTQKLADDVRNIGSTASLNRDHAMLLGDQTRSGGNTPRRLGGATARVSTRKDSDGRTVGDSAGDMLETAALPRPGPVMSSHDSRNLVVSRTDYSASMSLDDKAMDTSMLLPLRVGFVSKFFGREVQLCGLLWMPLKSPRKRLAPGGSK